MEPKKLPPLEHGITPPEELLPGTPWWILAILVLVAVGVIALLFWFRRGIKLSPIAEAAPTRDYYGLAKKSLKELKKLTDTTPVSEVAAGASLAMRGFLAGSLSEPALFETTEEFSERDIHLPKDALELLNDLNAAKYAPSHVDAATSKSLLDRTFACLKTLSKARTFPA